MMLRYQNLLNLLDFLFRLLVGYGEINYAQGLVDARKVKRICKHGNFIVDGDCMCSTCKKGIDYK